MRCLIVIVIFTFFPSIALAGDIMIYDANDDLLGIFVGTSIYSNDANINVFNSELSLNMIIETSNNRAFQGRFRKRDVIYFDNATCSGTPYLRDWMPYKSLVEVDGGGLYYASGEPVLELNPGSHINTDGICESGGVNARYRAATEVLVENLPFDYPVVFPLSFSYEANNNKVVVVPLP